MGMGGGLDVVVRWWVVDGDLEGPKMGSENREKWSSGMGVLQN